MFDKPCEFSISFERKRGRTEARLRFTKAGKEIDPLEGSAGGEIEVAAFALRLACLLLQRPKRRKLLILDEPFKAVHGTAERERVVQLLELLAREMKVQIILVTGLEWLRTGKVVEL